MSEELTIADYEQVLTDHRRIAREMDVAMFGEDAAKQASLCDIQHSIEQMVAENRRLKRLLRVCYRRVQACSMPPNDDDAVQRILYPKRFRSDWRREPLLEYHYGHPSGDPNACCEGRGRMTGPDVPPARCEHGNPIHWHT